MISRATAVGMLFVSISGNAGKNGVGCTLDFPCPLQDVLCVGAMDTLATNYFNRWPESGNGPIQIRQMDGTKVVTAGVDLMAPGRFGGSQGTHQWFPSSSLANYASSEWTGTSFAAPLVAGGAGLLRHAWSLHGAKMSARELMVNMLLMGDGYQQLENDEPWKARYINTLSRLTGAGSIKLRGPTSKSLSAPWGWGYRSFVIHQGELVQYTVGDSGPEDERTTEWKWALAFFDPTLESTSHLNIWVEDVCSQTPFIVQSDTSGSLRKRITLREDLVKKRCLVMNVLGMKVPDQGVSVVSADAYHSTPEYW